MTKCYKTGPDTYVQIPDDASPIDFGIDETTAEEILRMPEDFEHWNGVEFVKDEAKLVMALENQRLNKLSVAERQAEAIAKAEEKLLDKMLRANVITKSKFDQIKADKT